MTTNSDALHAYGALRTAGKETTAALCAATNIDQSRLEAYARQAIAVFVPQLSRQPMVGANLSLFDFSERKQSNHAAIVVNGSRLGLPESPCIVTRVGDALQEVRMARRHEP